ncbi:site-specific integrase [soil metagenome]
MASGQISKRTVDAISPNGTTQFLWDKGGREPVNGFGLRVTSAGTKAYVFQYRMGGRESRARRITIGKHGPWTPEQARAEAKKLARLVDEGKDPADMDVERRRQAVDLAFDAYVERFAESYLTPRWKRGDEAHRLLKRDAVKVLASRPLTNITRADLNLLWERMADRPALARQMFATMRKLFRWALSRGDIQNSPMDGADAPPSVPARNRVLSDQDLALIWEGAGKVGPPYEGFYKLLIATGQRKDEVAKLQWEELDRDDALWTLPADRAKNGVAHVIPLNALALDALDAIAEKDSWPTRGMIFSRDGKRFIGGFSKSKSALDQEIATLAARKDFAQIEPWRVHDLRRTLATGLQRLGARFEVTEAVLNHVSGSKSGIAGVYQRHDWKEEKRAALQQWGLFLAKLTRVQERDDG